MSRFPITAALLLPVALCAGAAQAQPRGCPELDPTSFESWSDIADWHREYPGCDDDVALTWIITGKLASGPDQFSALSRFLRVAPKLKWFFLSHVGRGADPRDVRKVRATASASCPADSKPLCRDVLRAMQGRERTKDDATRRFLNLGDYP